MNNPNKLFPLIITNELTLVKKFYCEDLGWRAITDLPQYLQVQAPGNADAPELCFMKPDEDFPPFEGKGLAVSVPTESADHLAQLLEKKGLTLRSQPEDRPWGWRSFFLRDPTGLVLDFFHVVQEHSVIQDATG